MIKYDWSINYIKEKLTEQLSLASAAFRSVSKSTGVSFYGVDCSLAPIPHTSQSVAALVNQVVGSGLAGGAASASLAELGYNVKTFCFQDDIYTYTYSK